MKTPVVGLTKSSHGTNIVEGNVAGEPAEARNEDILELALTALGVGAAGALAVKNYAANGAIAEKSGTVTLAGSGALAMSKADPVSGADDGKILRIVATAAHAHVITFAGGLGSGTNNTVTLGGAVGDQFEIEAIAGKWFLRPSINATASHV